MPAGPLDDPRLREVEECLNEARFEEAQRKLVDLGAVRDLGPGVAYLTTRLLAQRGRLDSAAVAERLRDVLAEAPDFPEARNYLLALGRNSAIDALGRAPTMSSQLRPPLPSRQPEPEHIVADSPIPDPPIGTLSRRAAPRPSALETPKVPPPAGYAPPQSKKQPPILGTLELPRSEMPTEPAPPPSEPFSIEPLRIEPEPASLTGRGVWDPVELDLASGRVESALSAL
ncbi:MAG TPA: hypothetical protein VFV94_03905, partial [Polyangiaceae bacterium]|nr:hypothetical protein [Polyangiaceae bacterium]